MYTPRYFVKIVFFNSQDLLRLLWTSIYVVLRVIYRQLIISHPLINVLQFTIY